MDSSLAVQPALQDEARSCVLKLSILRTDGGTRGRLHENAKTILDYSALMLNGVVFPPVRVWWDGANYWLSDGFHRLAAARAAGKSEIAAHLMCGSLAEARWDSYAANGSHGLRRSRADIQLVVRNAVMHPNSERLSTNQLALHIGVPESTLRRWRERLQVAGPSDGMRLATRRGKQYSIRTAAIGRHGAPHKAKTLRTLAGELDDMKPGASPSCRRILNLVGNWMSGRSDAKTVLESIEMIVGGAGQVSAI